MNSALSSIFHLSCFRYKTLYTSDKTQNIWIFQTFEFYTHSNCPNAWNNVYFLIKFNCSQDWEGWNIWDWNISFVVSTRITNSGCSGKWSQLLFDGLSWISHNTWTPIVVQALRYRREPDNDRDKCAVTVINKDWVVEYLMRETNGKFTKTVFFFLRVNVTNSERLTINRKAINKKKEMEMEFLRTITFADTQLMLNKLKKVLQILRFDKKYMVLTYFCSPLLNFHAII